MSWFNKKLEDLPTVTPAEREENLISTLRGYQSGLAKVTIENGVPVKLRVYDALKLEGSTPNLPVTAEEILMLRVIKEIYFGELVTNISSTLGFGMWQGIHPETYIQHLL